MSSRTTTGRFTINTINPHNLLRSTGPGGTSSGRTSGSRRISGLVDRLQESKQSGRLSNVTKLDAKGLHFDVHFLHVENLVSNEGLEEDADEPHESVLHVSVFDRVAGGNAVRNIKVNKLRWQFHRRRQPWIWKERVIYELSALYLCFFS